MIKIFGVFVGMIICFLGKSQQNFTLKEGDIIFQKLPCGNLCDAIIETTPCKVGRLFNHCGMIHFRNDSAMVIEAHSPKVEETPFSKFIRRDKGDSIYIGRLIHGNISNAIQLAQTQEGKPYDGVYLPTDSAIYCSELVWKSYLDEDQKPIFPPTPMTFKSPKTGATYPGWTTYYQSIQKEIPEGQLGTNPCAIANSDKIQFYALKKSL